MRHSINLNIPSPCDQKFEHFTPTTQGGFCDSCSKEVIDFTEMKRNDISRFFEIHGSQDICGRFKSSQLTAYSNNEVKRKRMNFITGVGIACLALFSFTSSYAQDNGNASNTTTEQTQKTILVKGTVKDDAGPLPGVNILLEGTRIGVASDFDGNFEFPQRLKKGDVLIFSYIGLKTQKVVINDENSAANIDLKIDMLGEEILIVGKVATKKVFKSNSN